MFINNLKKMRVYIFTKLFYLLLLLLLMCGTFLCGQVCAYKNAVSTDRKTVEIFKAGETISEVLEPKGGKRQNEGGFKVDNIYFPFLAATDDLLIAIARVKRAGKIEILTRYIENKELSSKDIASSKSHWTPQLAVENEGSKKSGDVIKGLLAVAKDDQIYLLLVTSGGEPSLHPSVSSDFELKFVVGTVKKEGSKKVEWDENALTDVHVTDKIKNKLEGQQLMNDYSFGGNAFLTHDGQVVFVLQMYTLQQNMFALINLNNGKAKVEFVSENIQANCYFYFFPWKKKIIMLSVSCNDESKKRVMESSNMGESWEKSEEAFSRHYNFLQYKKDFATVTIGKKEVLLFTDRKANSIGRERENIYLWMTDGNRVGFIGIVVNNVDGAFYRSVLQTNNSLSALATKYKTERRREIDKIFFTRQNEHLEKLKFFLNAWERTDKSVSELCKDTEKQNIICTTPPSIDGLVGFLHNTITVDTNTIIWKDEYYYSNVTVETTKAENVTNGLTFNGVGKGAEWQMKNEQNEKQYNFIASGFTLVATVKTGSSINGNHNSILGFYFTDLVNRVGLWCTKNGNWEVKYKIGQEEKSLKIDNKCEEGKIYNVAYMLNKEKILEIYVNGEQSKNLNNEAINIEGDKTILHFYFGADINPRHLQSTTESYVTITNVLLYNRPFKQEEIRKLKPKERNVNDTRQTSRKTDTNHQSPHGGTTQNGTSPQDTSTTENKNENKSSTTEDSAEPVGVVGVLCFMLFGVFTLLGRYVY